MKKPQRELKRKETQGLFESSYSSLNKDQRLAVDSIEGPVMVVAGPGTGKTQILTLRIANILRRADVNPGNILALTFTENAASAMKKRLASIIGSEAYSIPISTFHGFANDLILSNSDIFIDLLGSKPANDADRISVLRKGLRALKLKELRPLGKPDYYIKEIISSIESLKREGIRPEDFSKIIEKEEKAFSLRDDLYHEKGAHKGKMKDIYSKEEKSLARNKELVQIYSYYKEEMNSSRLYDYSDMILEVLLAIENNETFLQSLQEKYQYILVDEHQDTNRAQNRIIELICSFDDKPNLFIVGDEKQAIYRFQGASLENFEYFKEKFPSAKTIILEQNYRSHQGILDSAHSVLAGKKELVSALKEKKSKIEVMECESFEAEHYFVAGQIDKDIKDGVSPSEIAVLYRDNRDSLMVAQALASMGLPFVIESDKDILEDRNISKLLILLKYLVNPGEESLLSQVLHLDFLGVPTLDTYRILLANSRSRDETLFDILGSKERIKELKLESGIKTHELFSRLSKWSSIAMNDFILDALNTIANESGYLEGILAKKDSFETLEKFRKLFDEARIIADHDPQSTILNFIEYIDLVRDSKIAIKRNGVIREGRVRCMTAHASKGLEFERVYITGANDGHWGNKRRYNIIKLPDSVYLLSGKKIISDNEDERRLFYVAMTRAKKHLAITYSKHSLDGKELLPTQFIKEIKPELVSVGYFEAKDIKYSTKPKKTSSSSELKDLVKEIFVSQGLSVTALNNYLQCPWKYFYINLIRLPSPLEGPMMFGTAVHSALDDLLKSQKRTKEFLLERFRIHMEVQPMSRKEVWRWLEKGDKYLSSYFDNQIKNWKEDSISELAIRDIYIREDIKLNGKIDKLEILKGNEVNVVDYKTGTPKSRNDIEGKTKNSNGDIKRQLVFYKILLDRYKDGKEYKMVSAQVDFIQTDDSGKHKSEIFYIDKIESDLLVNEIIRVSDEIISFSFENKHCDDAECQYCTLRKMTI